MRKRKPRSTNLERAHRLAAHDARGRVEPLGLRRLRARPVDDGAWTRRPSRAPRAPAPRAASSRWCRAARRARRRTGRRPAPAARRPRRAPGGSPSVCVAGQPQRRPERQRPARCARGRTTHRGASSRRVPGDAPGSPIPASRSLARGDCPADRRRSPRRLPSHPPRRGRWPARKPRDAPSRRAARDPASGGRSAWSAATLGPWPGCVDDYAVAA